jgi:hypothetical protein
VSVSTLGIVTQFADRNSASVGSNTSDMPWDVNEHMFLSLLDETHRGEPRAVGRGDAAAQVHQHALDVLQLRNND